MGDLVCWYYIYQLQFFYNDFYKRKPTIMRAFNILSILALPTLFLSAEGSPVCSEGDLSPECTDRRKGGSDSRRSDHPDDSLDDVSVLEEMLREAICSDLEDKYADQGQLTKGGRKSVCDNKCNMGVDCSEFSPKSWFGSKSDKDENAEDDEPSAKTAAADANLGRAVCKKLKIAYAKKGFISMSERTQLCKYACSGFPIDCSFKSQTYESYDFMGELESWIGRLLSGEAEISKDSEILTEGMVDAWYSMSAGNLAILLSVIPVFLNQWKYYNYWIAVAMCFAYALTHLFFSFGVAITVHNCGIAVLCAVVPSGSPVLTEGLIGMVLQIGLVTAAFTTDYASQVVLFTMGFIGYFLAIYYCFFIRRQGANAGVVILILQSFVMAERIEFARNMFGITTNAQVIFEMSFNAIIPLGDSRYFGKNASDIALRIMRYLEIDSMVHIQMVALVAAQMFMLAIFRAALGAFYIHSLRYSFDASSLLRGAWIYSIDAFGGPRALVRMFFGYEPVDPRRLMYGLVGSVLLWGEAVGAYGLFLFRVGCSLSDIMVFRTTLGRAMHYLDFNVDFMQAAYSQDGAPPYVSLKMINDIANNVGIVFVEQSGRTKRGMGVLLRSANRTMLYSVKHVVDRAKMVTFLGESTSDPDFRAVGAGDDPIMAMKYEGDAVQVDMLSIEEVDDVKQLIFVNVVVDDAWEVLDRVTCVVPKFTLRNGKLYAAVNLRKGDSGGPCFATLSDGTVRFCGVVSQGNPRGGGGNIVSICYASDMLGGNSSDEESVGHGRTPKQFNAVRRRHFSSQDADKVRYDNARHLNRFLVTSQDTWDYCASIDGECLAWEDVRDPEQATEDYCDARTQRDGDEEQPGVDGHEEPPPDAERKKRKRDQKRRNKDKAVRKRNHYNHAQRCARLREILVSVYSDVDAENIYTAIVRSGAVPKLDGDHFISYADGKNFVLDRELPDPDWT